MREIRVRLNGTFYLHGVGLVLLYLFVVAFIAFGSWVLGFVL